MCAYTNCVVDFIPEHEWDDWARYSHLGVTDPAQIRSFSKYFNARRRDMPIKACHDIQIKVKDRTVALCFLRLKDGHFLVDHLTYHDLECDTRVSEIAKILRLIDVFLHEKKSNKEVPHFKGLMIAASCSKEVHQAAKTISNLILIEEPEMVS